jgi:hypothetical protein
MRKQIGKASFGFSEKRTNKVNNIEKVFAE